MSEVEYNRAGRQAAVLLKHAEIANIDRQVGIALDCIADWRRHRAWLEREITDLAAAHPGGPRQPATVRS